MPFHFSSIFDIVALRFPVPVSGFLSFRGFMDQLPDELVQYILSFVSNARDVACCSCLAKRWKSSVPYIPALRFPRNLFDDSRSDKIVGRMISACHSLQELVIFCPFSVGNLDSWVEKHRNLKRLEIRVDNLPEKRRRADEKPAKLDCISSLEGLESLELWGVSLVDSKGWGRMEKLHTLQIVGARLTDSSLRDVLQSCPNLRNLALLGCDGIRSLNLKFQQLEGCRLDIFGHGDCLVNIDCPMLKSFQINGADRIQIHHSPYLKSLQIANSSGRVQKVECQKFPELEFLAVRGLQWSWEAITSVFQASTEVKHLLSKIEFCGDDLYLQPFPEIDLVDFFNSHPKLCKFEIHGALFAALSQKNSLKSLDSRFSIPCLEEVLVTVRSPLNAEHKLRTLESMVKSCRRLKMMVIRVTQMKNYDPIADQFYNQLRRFGNGNPIVRIE